MSGIERSCLVESIAGRDKGRMFFVLEVEGDYVILADGKLRKTENPKRKKIKHIRFAANSGSQAACKIRGGEPVLNKELRAGLSGVQIPQTLT